MSERVPDSIRAVPDLSLVDFEDIWQELRRRFDTVVLAANKNLSDKKCQDTMKHSGTYLIGQGLCYRLLADIEDGIRENAESHAERETD